VTRVRATCAPAVDEDRLQAVWEAALAVTADEADAGLIEGFPYFPYDSSNTGDLKA